jgi:radical SAM superfamily enzyme YgiQ (UPF0313 family)
MTLLLILPPQHWLFEGFNSGLIALANYVDQHLSTVQVKLVDLSHVALAELRATVAAHLCNVRPPVVVGITTTTATYQSALAVARAVKEEDKGIPVILGGHHSYTEDEVILQRHSEVDFVIRGEGERALVHFLSAFPKVNHVPGLSYRTGQRIARNPEPPKLTQQELDQLSIEFRDLDLGYPLGRCDHVTYVSARGCPLSCSFCAVANERIRAKSIPQVIADIQVLVSKYGFRKIGMEDNFFAQSQTRTLALCRALTELRRSQPELDFAWDCQTRVESLHNPALVHALATAGCDGVFLGVENFDEETLRYLNKTRNPEGYIAKLLDRVLPLMFETQMTCFLNWQMGMPFERLEHQAANLKLLRSIGSLAKRKGGKVVVCPMLHVIYPGTYLFTVGVNVGQMPRDIFEALVGFQGRGFVDGVQPDFCLSLLLGALIFQ